MGYVGKTGPQIPPFSLDEKGAPSTEPLCEGVRRSVPYMADQMDGL